MYRYVRWPVFVCLAATLLWAAGARADYGAGRIAWEGGRYAEALTQWQAAARKGDRRAMVALGRAFVKGLGVPQDYVEAHKWFNLAAARGDAKAVAEARRAGEADDHRGAGRSAEAGPCVAVYGQAEDHRDSSALESEEGLGPKGAATGGWRRGGKFPPEGSGEGCSARGGSGGHLRAEGGVGRGGRPERARQA